MSDQQPQVYVTQESQSLNYAPAEEFGEVTFLTRGEISPFRNSLGNIAMMAELRQKLVNFRPFTDFLAPSGSPIITGLAFAILAERVKTFTVLRWSNRDAAYQPIFIDLKI